MSGALESFSQHFPSNQMLVDESVVLWLGPCSLNGMMENVEKLLSHVSKTLIGNYGIVDQEATLVYIFFRDW